MRRASIVNASITLPVKGKSTSTTTTPPVTPPDPPEEVYEQFKFKKVQFSWG